MIGFLGNRIMLLGQELLGEVVRFVSETIFPMMKHFCAWTAGLTGETVGEMCIRDRYDIVGGTDCDSSYNTESYQHGSKSSITWGIHEKVKIDDKSVCHVHVKRKLSFYILFR